MHVDPILPPLAGMALAVLLIGQILRRLHQPFVVVYLLAGVALGHHGLGLFKNETAVGHVGSLGVTSVGLQLGIIQEVGYQTTVAVITLSLFVSPVWINLIKQWTIGRRRPELSLIMEETLLTMAH